jgi:putative PIG3 family NAD(P)H quinone oxidoreductase
MKYVDMVAPGGPEVLQLKEADAPVPRSGEVLIKVAAAGVNRPDVLQRSGAYPPPAGASPILGLEVAGEVVALGKGCHLWHTGDKVCALANGGGYAEFLTVPETQSLPIPKGLDMAEAAGLPETCFTVWSNVFDRAGLKAGESFLVHGGSSGIGTTAIQMARGLGARVFATAGSDEKCKVCQQLGAEIAVNYQQQDFVEVLLAETNGNGVDVILDMVGGDYIARNVKVAAMEGRIVNINYVRGSKVEIDFRPVMMKRLTLTGSTLRPQSTEAKAAIARSLQERVWPLIEAGHMKPHVAKVFPLSEAAAAHRFMESGAHIGKIILAVDESIGP